MLFKPGGNQNWNPTSQVMDLDDADYSSGEEEFNEDALNNEDYDKLYELLPVVQKEIASYNDTVDELSIKEALYYNYFDVEPAIQELKDKFPKKKGMYKPFVFRFLILAQNTLIFSSEKPLRDYI